MLRLHLLGSDAGPEAIPAVPYQVRRFLVGPDAVLVVTGPDGRDLIEVRMDARLVTDADVARLIERAKEKVALKRALRIA